MVKDVMCSKPPPLPPLPGLARAPAGTGRAIVVYALCLEVVGAQAGAIVPLTAPVHAADAPGDAVLAPAVP